MSPITTMRRGLRCGSGSARPPTPARSAPGGRLRSQVSTGNAEGFDCAGLLTVGRKAMVEGGARTVIGNSAPSISITGHAGATVITRATATPSSPSTTNAARTGSALALASMDGGTGGVAHAASSATATNTAT